MNAQKKKHLQAIFKAYPKVDDLHETSDGIVFVQKNDADNAGRLLPNRTVVTHTRAVVMDVDDLTGNEALLAEENDRVAKSNLKEMSKVKDDLDEAIDETKTQVALDQKAQTEIDQEAADALNELKEIKPADLKPETPTVQDAKTSVEKDGTTKANIAKVATKAKSKPAATKAPATKAAAVPAAAKTADEVTKEVQTAADATKEDNAAS